ncbi:MAG: hypothetical protein HQK57_14725 [Deltaproteobacteria bacterium]|nr:hypothetical protein [Deltaproteobacteria bacterium]
MLLLIHLQLLQFHSEALKTMPTAKTIEHVEGRKLPAGFLKELGFSPEWTFTITIQPEHEDDTDYPPEEKFRPEFIAEMERRDREYDKSDSTFCRTKEEREAFLKKLWEEDDQI